LFKLIFYLALYVFKYLGAYKLFVTKFNSRSKQICTHVSSEHEHHAVQHEEFLAQQWELFARRDALRVSNWRAAAISCEFYSRHIAATLGGMCAGMRLHVLQK
jgi:hypothetical protein